METPEAINLHKREKKISFHQIECDEHFDEIFSFIFIPLNIQLNMFQIQFEKFIFSGETFQHSLEKISISSLSNMKKEISPFRSY